MILHPMDLQAARTQIWVMLQVSYKAQQIIPELQMRQEATAPFRLPHHRGTLIPLVAERQTQGIGFPLHSRRQVIIWGFCGFLSIRSGEGMEVCKETFDFLFFSPLTVAHFILFQNHPLMYPPLLRLKASQTRRLFLIHLGDLVTRIV